jgi:glucose-1-phosphate cytidylyltransferase
MSDVTFCMSENTTKIHNQYAEPWTITLVDTGESTMTGGRLKRVSPFIGDDTFCFTYGDGVSDINISELIAFHKKSGLPATVTSIQPPGRYGALNIEDNLVVDFQEKPAGDGAWINGGFFVLEPEVLSLIEGDHTIWEQKPLSALAENRQLGAYRHSGFWQAMDTLREKNLLEDLWAREIAPWKSWV